MFLFSENVYKFYFEAVELGNTACTYEQQVLTSSMQATISL